MSGDEMEHMMHESEQANEAGEDSEDNPFSSFYTTHIRRVRVSETVLERPDASVSASEGLGDMFEQYIDAGFLDTDLLKYYFSKNNSLEEAKRRFHSWYLKHRGNIEITFTDHLNKDPKAIQNKIEEGMLLQMKDMVLTVPRLALHTEPHWPMNVDFSMNFPIGLKTGDEHPLASILYPLEAPMPQTPDQEPVPYAPPALLLTAKPHLQHEFVRTAIAAANYSDTSFGFDTKPRRRRIAVSVVAPYGEEMQLKKEFGHFPTYGDPTLEAVKKSFGITRWFNQGRQLSQLLRDIGEECKLAIDGRRHHIVILKSLDALLSDAQADGSLPSMMNLLDALISEKDPRVHILATTGFYPGLASRLPFDWRLFGESRGEALSTMSHDLQNATQNLPPHQYVYEMRDTSGQPEYAACWVPKV